jgi:hypothetical protein
MNDQQDAWMRSGGYQLVELLEDVFGYDYLLTHYKRFGLSPKDLLVLHTWREHAYSIVDTIRALEKITGKNVTLFDINRYFGTTSLFGKLLREIDITPQFSAETGELIHTFSFIQYEWFAIEDTLYRIVETSVNYDKYWHSKPHSGRDSKYCKTYIFRWFKGRWVVTKTKFAREYMVAYRTMKKWM